MARRALWLLLICSPALAGGYTWYEVQQQDAAPVVARDAAVELADAGPAAGAPPGAFAGNQLAQGPAAVPPAQGARTAPKSRLIRALWDAAAQEELPLEDRNLVEQILADADPLWTRVQESNREAVRQANRQVRIPGRSFPVLLIVANGLEWDDIGLGLDGQTRMLHLDRLMAQGVSFPRYQGGAGPLAAPLYELWSGLRAETAQQVAAGVVLPRQMTLAETMWRGGYATFGVGRMGLNPAIVENQPQRRGFDSYLGFAQEPDEIAFYPPRSAINSVPFDVPANAAGREGVTADELYVNEALAALEWQRPSARPFFLYVGLLQPEHPAGANRDAAVAQVDEYLGSLLDGLDGTGWAPSSFVVFTTSGEGERPLVIRGPGLLAGSVFEEPVAATDLLPTLAQLADVLHLPRTQHGRSVVPALPRRR